jgi:hypothetical protein
VRVLAQAPAGPSGLDTVVVESPPAAATAAAAALQAEDSRVELLIRFSKGGPLEVLQATQVPDLIAPRLTWASDFAYELTGPTGSLFAEDLPADPFVVRGFPDPDGGGHSLAVAKSAVALVRVPGVTAADVLGGEIGLRLYKVKSAPGATAVNADVFDINLDTLNRLKGRKLLEKQGDYSPRTLSEKIHVFGSLDRQ